MKYYYYHIILKILENRVNQLTEGLTQCSCTFAHYLHTQFRTLQKQDVRNINVETEKDKGYKSQELRALADLPKSLHPMFITERKRTENHRKQLS